MCKCDTHANSTLAIDAIDLFIAIYCSNCGDKSIVENCLNQSIQNRLHIESMNWYDKTKYCAIVDLSC